MNIIDENIVFNQRLRLSALKIHYKQIGFDIGRCGMKDENDIIPLLHSQRRPTFFTRDEDYYDARLLHPDYCLVHLDVLADETAEYIRKFLRHAAFRTRNYRMGKVIRVRHGGLSYWRMGAEKEVRVGW